MREVLHEVLAGRGYDVVAAARGEEALSRARGQHFDLIIADIRMEGMNGLDTIEQAQQLQPGIGSIVVSGWASEEDTLRAVRLNVAGYLKKPFPIDSLVDLVNQYLARRSEELRRERAGKRVREALLWSLEQQGKWAERCHEGEVLGPANLAARLSRRLGYSGDLSRQLYLGVLMRRVTELGGEEVPEHVLESLASLPLLVDSMTEEEPSEVAAFALTLCAEPSMPTPESLAGSVSEALLEAYREASDGEAPKLESHDHSGLFYLAQTLEHAADWQGADSVYQEIIDNEGISHQAARALLGKARVSVARGDIKALEATVKKVLEVTRHLGPVSYALSEMETGLLLKKTDHPSTGKLLERAAKSLESVGLSFHRAQVVLAQSSLARDHYDQQATEAALAVLSTEDNRPELLENAQTLIPDIFAPAQAGSEAALGLLTALLARHPEELVSALAADRLDGEAKAVLVKLLSNWSEPLPANLLSLMAADSDIHLRELGLKLGDKQGQEKERVSVLKVHSLGGLELALGEERLDERSLKTQKVRFLLARLLGEYPKALAVDRLLEEFWPKANEKAKNNLNTAVSLIRQLLRDSYPNRDPLQRTVETLGVNPELPVWHDVEELERAYAKGRQALEAGRTETAMSCFRRVARLYRAPYLESCYMDWALERRARLEIVVSEALHHLMTSLLAQHLHSQAAEYALRLLGLQPDNVEAHEVLMQAYIGLGKPQKAVEHFESYKRQRAMEGSLDEPATELLRVYHMARYGISAEPAYDPDTP